MAAQVPTAAEAISAPTITLSTTRQPGAPQRTRSLPFPAIPQARFSQFYTAAAQFAIKLNDALNRVSGLGYTTQTGVYAYGRDNTGKLTSASEPTGRIVTWSYDGINRLTSENITEASGKNYAASYGLDPVGNRTSESSSIPGVPSGSWSFNADDELSGESYDANGNVTSASGKSFMYDSENHLVSMGATVGLLYDGDGNRVAKSVSGTVTRYLVDDLNPTGYPQVVEELTNGVVSRTYVYGLQRISELQPIQGAWTPSFYIYDGGGNVRQLTDTAGAMTVLVRASTWLTSAGRQDRVIA